MTATNRPSWAQRNKWGLILLLPALVLALAAASSRVQLFWWGADLHQPISGTQGRPLVLTDTFHAPEGFFKRSVEVTLQGVSPGQAPLTSLGKPVDTPSGSKWVSVALHIKADPKSPLSVCQVALRDGQGRQADYDPTLLGMGTLRSSPCVPEDHPGPSGMSAEEQAEAETEGPRPAEYDIDVPMLVADRFEAKHVLFWLNPPKYLKISVR
ncbi:MAG: hypothetical protein V9E81_14385 [Marmoricola sp.]